MKKILFILLCLLLVVTLFAGCAPRVEPPVENGADNNGDASNNGSEIKGLPSAGAGGDDFAASYESIPEAAFVNASTILTSTFPVYLNKYPTGQGGPQYVITDSLTDMMTTKLEQYLNILYGKKGSNYNITKQEDVTYKVIYDNGDMSAMSGVSDISILTSEYNIAQDAVNGNLVNNEIIKAGIEYLGIINPQVKKEVEYNVKDEPYSFQYIITESTDDMFMDILNSSFEYIKISCHTNSASALVKIVKTQELEKYGDYQITTFDQAVEYIKENYPNIESSTAQAEIIYSTVVRPEYFVPVYKFYVEDTSIKDKAARYGIIQIPMVDIDSKPEIPQVTDGENETYIKITDEKIAAELKLIQEVLKVGKSKEDIESAFDSKYHKLVIPRDALDFPDKRGLNDIHFYVYSDKNKFLSFEVGEKLYDGEYEIALITEVKSDSIVSKGLSPQEIIVERTVDDFMYFMDKFVDNLLLKRKSGIRIEILYSDKDTIVAANVFYVNQENKVNTIAYKWDGEVILYENVTREEHYRSF